MSAVDHKALCHRCRSDVQVQHCEVANELLCERCHVDEFNHSCEFSMEWKGRTVWINQHTEEDE